MNKNNYENSSYQINHQLINFYLLIVFNHLNIIKNVNFIMKFQDHFHVNLHLISEDFHLYFLIHLL